MREATESGLAHTSTSIFHFPVETGNSDTRSGGRDGRPTCRPAGPSDCSSVCAVGMAGQLGWGCRLEWHNTQVHPPAGLKGPVLLYRPALFGRRSFALGTGRSPRRKPHVHCMWKRLAGRPTADPRLVHAQVHPPARAVRSRPFVSAGPFGPSIVRTRYGPQPEEKAACSLHVEAPGGPTHG